MGADSVSALPIFLDTALKGALLVALGGLAALLLRHRSAAARHLARRAARAPLGPPRRRGMARPRATRRDAARRGAAAYGVPRRRARRPADLGRRVPRRFSPARRRALVGDAPTACARPRDGA